MARAIWSGAISFGLVNVPVKLYAATSPKTVRFHQLSSKTGARVKQKRVDATTGDEVPYDEIVKGYEITPDRYVVITPEELDTLEAKATKTIDVEDFVDLADIDPIYFDHAYYVAPATGGAKAYRLLLDAMRESDKVALARIVLRSKQQLAALRPAGDVLTLSTMLFGDEVLAPDRLDELDSVSEAEASERELKMARQLIDSLSTDFEPARYRDEYRDRVLALIERKAGGEEIAAAPVAEEAEAAPDLMAALEASLAAVKDDRDTPPAKAKPRKRAAAKDGAEDTKPKRRAAATK
jgi:DNA end-binding protein Ku